MEKRRVVQSLTVTYQTTTELLNEIPTIVKNIIESHDLIQFERCHFLRFLDSSLEFEVVFWINSPQFIDYADRAHSINVSIFKAFNEKGIDFAYPTQTVYVQKN
jgi:small-conductance mechanosensitive channel